MDQNPLGQSDSRILHYLQNSKMKNPEFLNIDTD